MYIYFQNRNMYRFEKAGFTSQKVVHGKEQLMKNLQRFWTHP